MTKQHGGPREGSGRKRSGPEVRDQSVYVTVSKDVKTFLAKFDKSYVELMVRRTAAFRRWKDDGKK